MGWLVGRHREAAISLTVCAIAIGAVTIIYHELNSHPGGDPNGIILRSLDPVLTAIPPNAVVEYQHGFETTWQEACPDNPSGRSGWWFVEVGVEFRSELSPTVVTSDVGSVLLTKGWRLYRPNPASLAFAAGVEDMLYDRIHLGAFDSNVMLPGDTPNWTKHLPLGKAVDAALVRVSERSWFLGASAEPPGFAVPGC